MKKYFLSLFILFAVGCQSITQKRLNFPAEDKKQHYEWGYTFGKISLPILPLGFLLGVFLGGGKELIDCFSFGSPELEDFQYTAEGSWDGYIHTWERSFYGFDEENNRNNIK